MQERDVFDDILQQDDEFDSALDDIVPDVPLEGGQVLPEKRVTPEGYVQGNLRRQIGSPAPRGSALNRWAGSLIRTIYEGARGLRPIGVQGLSRQDEGLASLGAQFFGERENIPNIKATDGRKLTYAEGTPEWKLGLLVQEARARGDNLKDVLKKPSILAFGKKHKLAVSGVSMSDMFGLQVIPGITDTVEAFGEGVGAGLNQMFGTQLFGNTENWNAMYADLANKFEVWTPEGRERFLKALDEDPAQMLADAAMLTMLGGKGAGAVGRGTRASGRVLKSRNLTGAGDALMRLDRVLNEGFVVPGVEAKNPGKQGVLSYRDPQGRLVSKFGLSEIIDPEEWGARTSLGLMRGAASRALSPFRSEYDEGFRERLQRLGLDPETSPETLMSRSQRVAQVIANRAVQDDPRTVEEIENAVIGFEAQFDKILADAHASGDIGEAAKSVEEAYNAFEARVRAEANKGYDEDTPERRDFIMSLRNTYNVLYGEGGLIEESKGLEASIGTSDFDANPVLRGFDDTMQRIQESGEAGIDPEFVEAVEAGQGEQILQGGPRKEAQVDVGDVQRSNRFGQAQRVAFSPVMDPYAVEYDAVPLEQLVTSHTWDGQEHPLYAELVAKVGGGTLQTRQYNGRMVRKIASDLRSEAYLLDLMATDRGAPIAVPVEHEGQTYYLVIAGNNRVEALEMARREYPSDWTLYQEELPKVLPDYGLDPVSVSDTESPVLFRKLLDDVNLEKFAADSNADTARRHATGEQAVKDALTLEDEVLGRFNFALSGDIGSILQDPSNQEALRAWLPALEAEAGDMYVEVSDPADGSTRTELTKQGVQRLSNALFRKVFASQSGLRMLELFETVQSSGIKNIERAIEGAFPVIADIEIGVRAIKYGQQYAIAELIAEAVVGAWEITRHGAIEGIGMRNSIQRYLAQGNLPGVTAIVEGVARTILEVVDASVAEPVTMTGFMRAYRQGVGEQVIEGGLFDTVDNLTQEALVYQAKDAVLGENLLGELPPEVVRQLSPEQSRKVIAIHKDSWDADPDVFYRITTPSRAGGAQERSVMMNWDADGDMHPLDEIYDELEAEGRLSEDEYGNLIVDENTDWEWSFDYPPEPVTDIMEERFGIQLDYESDFESMYVYAGLNGTKTFQELRNYEDMFGWVDKMVNELGEPAVVEVIRGIEIGPTWERDGYTFEYGETLAVMDASVLNGIEPVASSEGLPPSRGREVRKRMFAERQLSEEQESFDGSDTEAQVAFERAVDEWTDDDRRDYVFGLVDVSELPGEWMSQLHRWFDIDEALARKIFQADDAAAAIAKWKPIVESEFIIDPEDIAKRELQVRVDIDRKVEIDIKGRDVAGHREIAVLAQSLRDPATEYATVIYVDENPDGTYRVRGHEVTTIGKSTSTRYRGFSELEKQRKKYSNNTKIVFLHNHPSASAHFSEDDKKAMAQWESLFGEHYLGDVVINSGTYAYRWATADSHLTGDAETKENVRLEESELGWDPDWQDLVGEPFQPQIRPNDPAFQSRGRHKKVERWNQSGLVDVASGSVPKGDVVKQLVRFGKAFQTDRNWVTIAMSSSWGRLNALIQVRDVHRIPKAQRVKWLRDLALLYGGAQVHIFVGRGDWFRQQQEAIDFFQEINNNPLGGGIMSVRVGNNKTAWVNTEPDFYKRGWRAEFSSTEMVAARHEPRRGAEHMTRNKTRFNKIMKDGFIRAPESAKDASVHFGNDTVWFSLGAGWRGSQGSQYGFIFDTDVLMEKYAAIPQGSMFQNDPEMAVKVNEFFDKRWPNWSPQNRPPVETQRQILQDFMRQEGLSFQDVMGDNAIEILSTGPIDIRDAMAIVDGGEIKVITEATRGLEPSKWEFREAKREGQLKSPVYDHLFDVDVTSADVEPPKAKPDTEQDYTTQRTPYTYGNAEDFSTKLRRQIQSMERSDTANPQELRWYKKLRNALEQDMTESLRAHRPDLSDKIDAIDLAYAQAMTKMNSDFARHIQKSMGSDLVDGTGNYRKMVTSLFNPSMDVESVDLVYELIGGRDSDAGKRLRRVFLDTLFSESIQPKARMDKAKQKRGEDGVLKSWQRISPAGLSSALGKWQRNTGQYPAELLEAILGKETVDILYDLDSLSLQFERVVARLATRERGGSQSAHYMQEFLRSDYRAERLWYALTNLSHQFGVGGAVAGGAAIAGAGMMSIGIGAAAFIVAWLGTGALNVFMEYIKDKPVGRRYLLEGTVVSMAHVLTGDPIFASRAEAAGHRAKVEAGKGVSPADVRFARRLVRRRDDEDE